LPIKAWRKNWENLSVFFDYPAELRKMIYLAYRDIAKKWKMALPNWGMIISQLSIKFEERLQPFL